MKIVYITGCLGFIGSHLTRACLKKGWKVRGIDNISYAANYALLSEFEKYDNFFFEKKDIVKLSNLYDCDYVINTAAESHVGNSIINSKQFTKTNILGVQNLLDLIRKKPTNTSDRPIFLHFSTDEVYGDSECASSEESLMKPSNPYSASKAAADMLITAWSRTYNLKYLIVRPSNNYGTHQYPEKLIPLAVKMLQRGNKIKLHNKGEPERTWLHVEDTVDAVLTIIESGVENEIFNISGDYEDKNINVVQKIINNFFHKHIELEKYVDFSHVRQGQDIRYRINDSKLRSLGWKPSRSFDKELQSIIEYYRSNFIW